MGEDDESYPVKMNFGCFLPILIFAVIGFFSVIEILTK